MQSRYDATPEDLDAEDPELEDAPPPRRIPTPLRALMRTGRDWWRDFLVLGLACFAWGLLSLTIVLGPPAGAALYVIVRGSALHEQPDIQLFIGAARTYFLRSWLLALISVAGIAIWAVDFAFYLDLLGGLGLAGWLGAVLIFYAGFVWLLTVFYAWPQMICRNDLTMGQLLRNSVLLALRFPANSLVAGIILAVLGIISFVAPPLIVLATPALVALLGFHNLVLVAPELVPDESDALSIVG